MILTSVTNVSAGENQQSISDTNAVTVVKCVVGTSGASHT